MSVGHREVEPKSKDDLYLILGEADTSKLYGRTKRLVTSKDVPYGGGASVDGEELFIDRQFYREMLERSPVRGMTGRQIIACVIEHEGTEISIELGDNPCDVYGGSHSYATTKEDETADAILGKGGCDRYNAGIRPALDRCLKRSLAKIKAGTFDPPRNLWCGPYLDSPTATDRILIRGLRAKGVADAFKLSKSDPSVMYGIGAQECCDCAMYQSPKAELSLCDLVCGMVRATRQCKRYVERK